MAGTRALPGACHHSPRGRRASRAGVCRAALCPRRRHVREPSPAGPGLAGPSGTRFARGGGLLGGAHGCAPRVPRGGVGPDSGSGARRTVVGARGTPTRWGAHAGARVAFPAAGSRGRAARAGTLPTALVFFPRTRLRGRGWPVDTRGGRPMSPESACPAFACRTVTWESPGTGLPRARTRPQTGVGTRAPGPRLPLPRRPGLRGGIGARAPCTSRRRGAAVRLGWLGGGPRGSAPTPVPGHLAQERARGLAGRPSGPIGPLGELARPGAEQSLTLAFMCAQMFA